MHLDARAAGVSMLGELAGSGWQSCCLIMRMISDGFLLRSSYSGCVGVEEVRWLAPLRPGLHVSVRATVVETHVSRNSGEAGIVSFLLELHDAAHVASMRASLMFGRRPSGSDSDVEASAGP